MKHVFIIWHIFLCFWQILKPYGVDELFVHQSRTTPDPRPHTTPVTSTNVEWQEWEKTWSEPAIKELARVKLRRIKEYDKRD